MATYDSRALRRPARTDRRASGGRSGNRRGKNPARKRVVRRHFPYHVPNERRSIAAREIAARDRAARNRRCADGAQFPRVFTATACVTDCRSPCRSKLCAFTNLNNPRENIMTNQTNRYEPLTSQNAALILVDHQVGLMTGVRDCSTGELKHNVVALAKAAQALKLPIVATTTARDSMWGPTFPELVEQSHGCVWSVQTMQVETKYLRLCQPAALGELEAGNALATWQHSWFGKLPELPAIHERFKDILLDVVVAINYG